MAEPEDARAAAVVELCGGDVALQREIESLLANLTRAEAAGFDAPADLACPRLSLVGRQVGPYHIRSVLGIGGMGEVYRAHDSTLGRDVALKILPEPWLDDPTGHTWFEREARLLASLNHPNVASIHGVHTETMPSLPGIPLRALVLELIDGETLAERIAHAAIDGSGPGLPVAEALTVAMQMAEGLEAAHARGIVHRDLKPSNIKLTPDGVVKVLDFGLATVATHDSVIDGGWPTDAGAAGTAAFGTAPYMSPEQASGRPVDRRADIWAFGCVLFEMLTGRQPFEGQDEAAVLEALRHYEPDWTLLPADTPPSVHMCLQRCLTKDPRRRFQDIGDVRLALDNAFEIPAGSQTAGAARPRVWPFFAGAGFVVLGLMIYSGLLKWWAQEPLESRLEIVTPPAGDPWSFALSPDGRRVVFSVREEGRYRLWLRPLETGVAAPIAGTEGAEMPFWSSDSRSVGFFASGTLKRVDVASGVVRVLATAPHPRRGTWNGDGTIVFGPVAMGPLSAVSADGGAVRTITKLLPGQVSHRWPQFLPDGRRFLLTALGTPDTRGLYLGSLDDRRVTRVSDRESGAWLVAPDHLLLARGGALLAGRLDRNLRRGATLTPVASRVLLSGALTGYAAVTSSATGAIAYRESGPSSQFVWLDREGRVASLVGEADDSQPVLSYLSRDGRVAAVQRIVNGHSDVWLVDTVRGAPTRLTSGSAFEGSAILSPDGQRVVLMSDEAADVWDTVFASPVTGGGLSEVTRFAVAANHYPMDWSPDGRFILYGPETAETQMDLWALPLSGHGAPIPVARTAFFESHGRFSPDGKWVAYSSDETGRSEVYVQPFPGPGVRLQVSSTGGWRPRWHTNGDELFFVGASGRLITVPLRRRGATLDAGLARELFTFPQNWEGAYEPSPDGNRFLITTVVREASPITVILNWKRPPR